jgi:hypothetical protein
MMDVARMPLQIQQESKQGGLWNCVELWMFLSRRAALHGIPIHRKRPYVRKMRGRYG